MVVLKKNVSNNNGQLLSVVKHPTVVSRNVQLVPEILCITSYPPRECGIATYSQDLIKALENKFNASFKITVCPIESNDEQHVYPNNIVHTLNTNNPASYINLVNYINEDTNIKLVVLHHEFGLFHKSEGNLLKLLQLIDKPIIVVFHTVLPSPNKGLKCSVEEIVSCSDSVIVMTNSSANILMKDYDVAISKITVLPHGTHLVTHENKNLLKEKYNFKGRKVLSTFGLLGSGKSIETTLMALPTLVKQHPNLLFLIIGKTHPSIVKNEGEIYRNMLLQMVVDLNLQEHVLFVNYFLPLSDLLEYLQLTDIYLFTSKDPNQAVSGTFAYALSCGCTVVSTPIPHAIEVLQNSAGVIIDFESSGQLSDVVNNLLLDDAKRESISLNGLHKMASTAWENIALLHGELFKEVSKNDILLDYRIPILHLTHLKKLTTNFGMIQFSKINQPDISSGYTLDDNARALITICKHFETTRDHNDIQYILIYFNFIKHCLQDKTYFLNYVDEEKNFTQQNYDVDLADSNGRAIWALGYLISMANLLPTSLIDDANTVITTALLNVKNIHSTRAMAFIVKGLYYRDLNRVLRNNTLLIEHFADKLVQMYRHERDDNWDWFESYFTYGNSLLPEAILCAWLATGKTIYKDVAKTSFDFLLMKIFTKNTISVISNKGWFNKGDILKKINQGGEQPIDVAYTILALEKFYNTFLEESYLKKMKIAFSWFLGNNHLHQIIYNPCTGGCYDGLEENYVNLNQGAESTVSYLMARLTIEKYLIPNYSNKKISTEHFSLIN